MKKTAISILLVSSFIATPSASLGEMHDGNILLDDCKEFLKYMDNKEDPSVVMASIGYCLGYMQGHLDYQQYLEENFTAINDNCIPVNVSVSKLAKVTVKYLESNPNELNNPAIELTLAAFAEAFPCSDSLNQLSK